MAKRAVQYSVRSSGEETPSPSFTRADTEAAPQSVPLNIAPLLAPYRGRGRLSLRIENVPQRARFSGGRNNGDNSWSLATDELEGLQYLPPAGPLEPHSLSIRILCADAAGEVSTVAVVDYPVSALPEPPAELTAAIVQRESKTASHHDAKLSRLEAELERVRAVLTAHENVLSSAEQRAGRAAMEVSAQTIERELAKAREVWDTQQDRRLAETAAAAAADLERRRDTWQAEMDARLAQSEELARRELAEARERWRLEMQSTLSKAERAWKADESTRFATAETEWRNQAGAASARASQEDVAARERAEAEVQRLREKLSEALATVADREATLAKTQLESGRVREIALKERDVALRAAQKSWQAEETRKLTQAQAGWREESEQIHADLVARCQRAEASLAQALAEGRSEQAHAQVDAEKARNRAERDLSEMRVQFMALKKTLVESESEMGHLREAMESARERSQLEMDGVLERAQAAWRSEAAARLAAAKAKWSQESAQSLAAAHAESEILRDAHAAELRQVQQQLERSQGRLVERDTELARMGSEAQEAQERLQQEVRAQLASAQRAWKAEEAARLSAAKAEWQKSHAAALAEATTRYQAAETALARQRAKTEDELRRGDNTNDDSEHLREQIVLLQAALARCERELAHLRSGATQQDYEVAQTAARQNWAPLSREFGAGAQDDQQGEGERRSFLSFGLLREAVVLFGLVAGVIISFPYWLPYLPDEWQAEIVSFLGSAPAAPPPKAAPPALPKLAVAPPALHLELVVNPANLRSDPSLSAGVVSRLNDGTEVAVVEQRGDWTHVRTTSKSGTTSEGWIYNSHLKDEPAKP
jgi:hypothetical protein